MIAQNNEIDSVVDDVFEEKAHKLYETRKEDELEPSYNSTEIEDLVKEIKRARTNGKTSE